MTTTAIKKLLLMFFTSFALIQPGNAGIGFGAISGSLTFNSLVSVKEHSATLTKKPAASPKRKVAQRHVTRPGKMLHLTSR